MYRRRRRTSRGEEARALPSRHFLLLPLPLVVVGGGGGFTQPWRVATQQHDTLSWPDARKKGSMIGLAAAAP